MKKILVNIVHPNINESKINKKLLSSISKEDNITINNLYDNYPDFKINVKKEQDLLLSHDVIVFQFPMYWFSSPALLKEWFDTVFEYGFAHGDSFKLKNKIFSVAISCGAEEKEFCETGKDKKTVEEFLFPFAITANYVKMKYKKAFISYGTENNLAPSIIEEYSKNYVKYLHSL